MSLAEPRQSNHVAVVDLGYGDSGKGLLTARLCATQKFSLVAKVNGGSQCAHNVVLDSGTHFTFSQFCSGTFHGVRTYLGKGFMFEPFSLLREAEGLADAGVDDPLRFMHIAWNAKMTTPYHWILNKWQEDQRGENRHGSTGRGIGMTAYYALERPGDELIAADLYNDSDLYTKLIKLRQWTHEQGVPETQLPTVSSLFERYSKIQHLHVVGPDYFYGNFRDNKVIFEGSQGVLLDEDYGFHPHTTWSRTTDAPAREHTKTITNSVLFGSAPHVTVTTIGVVRAYTTRHGAGPFVTEDATLDIPEPYNGYGKYQGGWRQGHLDLPALRYAVSVCDQVDGVYVTHTDSVNEHVKWCQDYELDSQPFTLKVLDPQDFESRQKQTEALYKATPVLEDAPTEKLPHALAEALGKPLYGFGWGPRVGEHTFRRDEDWF